MESCGPAGRATTIESTAMVHTFISDHHHAHLKLLVSDLCSVGLSCKVCGRHSVTFSNLRIPHFVFCNYLVSRPVYLHLVRLLLLSCSPSIFTASPLILGPLGPQPYDHLTVWLALPIYMTPISFGHITRPLLLILNLRWK